MKFALIVLLTLAAMAAASPEEAAADYLRELLDSDNYDNEAAEAAAEAAAEEKSSGDSDDDSGDDDSKACHPEPRTVTKTLGGKDVTQTTVQLVTKFGCKRVLQGGKPEDFTNAENCAHCKIQGTSGISCVGPALAWSTKCKMVRGPDCQMYAVSHDDPAKACPGA